VERLSAASFLLKFDNQAQRNAARRFGSLRIGQSGLQLLPWTRQVGVWLSCLVSSFRFVFALREFQGTLDSMRQLLLCFLHHP
jgi:hypothetical protein